MHSRRRKIKHTEEKTLGGRLMGLSLFFMLLAFFMVLNAISTYEEAKSKPIMGALNYTFNTKVLPSEEVMPSVSENEDVKSTGQGDTLERMKALFNGQIAGESAINKTRGELYIRVPFDEFNNAVIGVSQGKTGTKFTSTFLSLMKNDEAGAPLRMDMLLGVSENPAAMQNDDPQRLARLTKDMSAIAERLETAGLQKKLISTGVQKGDDGIVELIFRRHIPYNPLGAHYDE